MPRGTLQRERRNRNDDWEEKRNEVCTSFTLYTNMTLKLRERESKATAKHNVTLYKVVFLMDDFVLTRFSSPKKETKGKI